MNKVIKNLLLNFLPLVFPLLLYLLSFVKDVSDDFSTLIIISQMVFVVLLVPTYLLFINIRYTYKNNKYLFVHRILLMIVLQFILFQIIFCPWDSGLVKVLEFISFQFSLWTWSSQFVDPDTCIIILTELILPSLIILLVGCIFQIMRYLKYGKIK